MSSMLPEDCLVDIFEYLRNDFKSLNSCVRVNRIWNTSATSILWSNPWVIKELNGKSKDRRQIKLIDIYISSLPQQSKSFLQKKGFVIPKLSQPFIYNYTSLMKVLNISYIEDCVWTWVTNQRNGSIREFIQKVELIILHLLQLIFKESNIRKIVAYYVSSNKDTLPQLIDIITRVPDLGTCFSHLQEIECDSTIPIIPKVFEMLIQYSKEVKRIVIKKYEDSVELGDLIGNQTGLQDVIICHDNYNYQVSFTNQQVFEAIKVQSKNLLRLELSSFDFPIHILEEFENLEELKLFRYGSALTTREDLAPLATISLKRLKKVIFHNWFLMNLDFFARFFEHTNEELREIVIKSSYSIADRQNTGKLVNSIGFYCSKLEALEIPVLPEDGQQMKNLLESCKKLQNVVIYNVNDNFHILSSRRIILNQKDKVDHSQKMLKEAEEGNLLQIFTNHSSYNLNNLSIFGIEFSVKDIESFLEYRSLISRPILFYLNFGIDKQINKLLKRYKKRGILIEDERTFIRKKSHVDKRRSF